MTIKKRKARRAANAASRLKSAPGGRQMQADHSECEPGAPCCAAFHADREWFSANPGVTQRIRDLTPGEFDDADPAVLRTLGDGAMVLVWRISPITRARIPLTAEQAATNLRNRGRRPHG